MKKIENVEVAWILSEIADLLELKGENIFKIRAYQKAARVIANLTVDLGELLDRKELQDVPGIGNAIAGKIQELLQTGSLIYYEKLKTEIPVGLLKIIAIPGVGPKMARELYQELGITSIEELEIAVRNRKLRELPGMGSKTELNILRGIEMLRNGVEVTTLGIADALGEMFSRFLRTLPGVAYANVAGSTRRMKDSIGDIDLVAGAEQSEKVLELFVKHPQVKEVLLHGDTKASVVSLAGIRIDLMVVTPEQFWSALHHFTGSKEHNIKLREIAHKKGLKINEYGIFDKEGKQTVPVTSEEDIYTKLGLKYIPPEIREDLGEIEAALEGTLPKLIEMKDIKGDLHVHSDWSDGGSTIQQIVGKAETMGYEYVAITDHSKSLGIARGLTIERLREQGELIKALDDASSGLRILSGIEADILTSGELDYPDEILAERDIVVASIHSGFRQDRDKLTGRIISAMKNEHVDILAHPTGRLIGRRDPYAVDMEAVLSAAEKYGTALEINCSPDRLDLNDKYARQAAELGIKISINTDAHDMSRMDEIKYGVATARRGWLEKDDVLNTMSAGDILKYLQK